jgi:dihydropteroate synthase
MPDKRLFKARGHAFALGVRTWVMGILNVTPDSFSDGGAFDDPDAALARALAMAAQGADILDIGGESTRPGHRPISAEEEAERVIPILRKVCAETGLPVSIDTSKASVAREAVLAGACIINDVRATRADPDMARVAAETGAGLILMYNATPLPEGSADPDPSWAEEPLLMDRIVRYLSDSMRRAILDGVGADRIAVDPGIGFGVDAAQSCEILRRLSALSSTGAPILIGPSRKSFIGTTLGLPVEERLMGTAAAVAIGIANGADFVRVHDVREMVRVARMTDAIVRGGTVHG